MSNESKEPLVSVIIPTYNRAYCIENAIQSVLNQSYKKLECIVVDDVSTDTTLDVLSDLQKKDDRLKFFIRNRLPKGAPTCRNIGLKKASGKYVIFLDSDDYFTHDCLSNRIEAYSKNSNMNFLVFPMGIIQSNTISKKEIPQSEDYLINFLRFDLPWSIMCPIWQKDFLLEISGYKEGYPRFNDPELMIRALLQKEVKYKVFPGNNYDSVYKPSKMDATIFKNKVFRSLKLFIPDISKELENSEKTDLKFFLQNYLSLWFKFFFVPSKSSKIKNSLILVNMFYKYEIISVSRLTKYYFYLVGYSLFKRFKWRLIKTYY